MKRYQLTLFADAFHFRVQDQGARGDLSLAWDRPALARLLAVEDGVVGIGTVRDMDVPVTVEVLDDPPGDDTGQWDQVCECSLAVPSGRLVVAGPSDYLPDALTIELASGCYRLRACYGDLDSLSDDGLDGNDHYRLQLWPAPPAPLAVIRARSAPPA